jgi:hypothetical protein
MVVMITLLTLWVEVQIHTMEESSCSALADSYGRIRDKSTKDLHEKICLIKEEKRVKKRIRISVYKFCCG